MTIGPTTYFGKERVFVDREACIRAFRENISKLGAHEYNVLFYYGIAGIGKSKLQIELQRILDKEYPEICWVSIDLDVKTYRDIGTFLITLQKRIQEKRSVRFDLFNTVHAIYWKKLHPEIPLQSQNYPKTSKEDIFDKIASVLDSSGKISLAWEILSSASDRFRKWCHLHHLDISKLESLEPNKIEELMPGIFAADFCEYFGKNPKFYVFIDTYEAIWEGLRDIGSFHEKDGWIRNKLIPNMLGVSWIISGREKLLWVPECDPEWDKYLEQHSVDELTEIYCQTFLEACDIKSKEIRDIIFEASEGVPYYLNLSVDTYEKIKICKKGLPISTDFGKTQPEIFNTFVKYLYSNEIRALEILSAPNLWDRNLFEILMKKFDPGLPIGAFSELIKFSFIKTHAIDKYSIHQLMRNSLQDHQNSVDRKNVHKFMFEYYSNELKELDIKSINPEHENALVEAFYHAKTTLETEDLFNWFIDASYTFYKADFWQLIFPIYQEMLQILEVNLGSEHRYVVKILDDLALIYESIGNYTKAHSHFTRALEIIEKIEGAQNPQVGVILYHLAKLYEYMGDYENSVSHYQRSLEVSEKALGSQHYDVAIIRANLADLYRQTGNYRKAISLFELAIGIILRDEKSQQLDVIAMLTNFAKLYGDIGAYKEALHFFKMALEESKKLYGSIHPNVAICLNNLGLLYRQMGDYKNALLLLQKALEINEMLLGLKHPELATTLENLGKLYRNLGDYEKALPLYQRSLDIRINSLGPQHPLVAMTFNNLGVLYKNMGDYENAILLYQKALEIYMVALGPQHPEVAKTLNNIGLLYKSIGAYGKALPFHQMALEIYVKVFGPQHIEVLETINYLSELYLEMGDYELALQLCQMALKLREETLSLNNSKIDNQE